MQTFTVTKDNDDYLIIKAGHGLSTLSIAFSPSQIEQFQKRLAQVLTPEPPPECACTQSDSAEAVLDEVVVPTRGKRKLHVSRKAANNIGFWINPCGKIETAGVVVAMADATRVRDALSAFIGDEPEPVKAKRIH